MKSIAVRAAAPRRGAGRAGACLALLAMVVTMVVPVLAPAPAHADVNTGITISNLRLAKTDASENPQSGNLDAGSSIALITFDWDASNADLRDGDSFSIDLPEELRFRVPQTRAFTHFVDGVETEVGTCVIAETNMTCTFNEVLPLLIRQGYNLLSGSGKIQGVAVKSTTEEELPFTVNGSQTVMVDLPGQGGITAQQIRYVPDALSKGATAMSERSTGVTWVIGFGTERLQEEYAANGVDVTFDGQTVHEIELTDLLGPGQSFPDGNLTSWRLTRRNSATESNPQTAQVVLANGAESSRVTVLGEFSLKVVYGQETDSGQSARIVLTGPFAPQSNYQLIYDTRATTEDGLAVPGFIYENYVSIDGTSFERDATKSFLDSFSLTVNMRLGYGTFSLDKYVTGPASDQVPAGSTFTVNLSYQLPEGTTRATYPEWEPPGTLNADQASGTASYEVITGRKNVFVGPNPPVTFPAGTVVTLTEAEPSVPLPEGYSWGESLFVVGGIPTSTLTIANQQVLGAELTNMVRAEPSTFEVVKTASGAPGVADKDYTFTYTCSDGQEGTLVARGDGTPVRETGTSFEVGTTCTITESTEGVGVSGYNLEAPLSQRLRIAAGSDAVAQAEFTNTYVPRTGTFTVAKTVAGEGDFALDKFSFSYTCTDGTEGTLEAYGTGRAVSSPEIAEGATCEITEDAGVAAKEGYSVDSQLSDSTVTISQDAPVAVTAVNTYTKDEGTFSVAKSVAGDGDFSGDTFVFDYTCSTGESGTLEVPGDGTAVSSPVLPAGAVCEVAEQEGSAARQGYSVDTELSGGKVTIVTGEDTAVTATNTYTQDTGTFSVTKEVAGDGDFGGATYSVAYECTLPDGSTSSDTLGVAGGGTVNGPSLPVGTQCVVNEEDASRAGYALATSTTVDGEQGSSLTIAKDVTRAVVVTNTYTQQTGGFEVAKTVDGDASAGAPEQFVFGYTCTTDDGSDPSGEVVVRAGESAHVEVPVGECVVTERDASVSGADLTTAMTVDGQAAEAQADQATVTVTEGSAVAVEVTNTYTAHRGTFSVAKTTEGLVEGTGLGEREFSFSYTCADGSQGTLSAKADGQAVQAEQSFAVGTECTVTENAGSAQIEGYDLTVPEDQTVSITEQDQVAATSFTNTYTPQTGSFTVSKAATGADEAEGLEGKEFSFSYICDDGTEGTLVAKADGQAVDAEADVVLGSECTVSEDTDAAAIEGYDLDEPEAQKVTVDSKDTPGVINVTNAYTKQAEPEPEPSPSPSEGPAGEPSPSAGASEEPAAPPATTTPSEASEGPAGEPSPSAGASEESAAPPATTTPSEASEGPAGEPSPSAGASEESAAPPATTTPSEALAGQDGSSASSSPSPSTAAGGAATGSAPPKTASTAPSTGSLARTGVTILLPIAIALAAIAGGVALLRRRRL
ncbi:peptidase [Actinomyces sp. 2119]|uniref:DUF5979 domain-containing protein n=1 Tax=Actinomyces sp. 2119 TaxID=2321393 RepID=UPI000E6D3E44|nr:DUF5979 domain-containing protein [Actinomyces sp. 2119]RJF40992.1 peptidase [Actinomyces sp. 2119]